MKKEGLIIVPSKNKVVLGSDGCQGNPL